MLQYNLFSVLLQPLWGSTFQHHKNIQMLLMIVVPMLLQTHSLLHGIIECHIQGNIICIIRINTSIGSLIMSQLSSCLSSTSHDYRPDGSIRTNIYQTVLNHDTYTDWSRLDGRDGLIYVSWPKICLCHLVSLNYLVS